MLADSMDHAVWNLLLDSSLCRDLRFPVNRVCEDYFFSLDLAQKTSLLFTEKKYYIYLIHLASMSHSPAFRLKYIKDTCILNIKKIHVAEENGFDLSLRIKLYEKVCQCFLTIMQDLPSYDLLDGGFRADLSRIAAFIDGRRALSPSTL
jgi:hypothetical protein